MRKEKLLYFLLFIFFSSCSPTEKKSLDGIDTAKIFQLIFDNNLFVKENQRKNSDTLYFLKSKYVNNNWPMKSKHFNIAIIDSTSQAMIVNFGPSSPYDGRRRLSVLKFSRNKDLLNVLILRHGDQIYFDCTLKSIGGNNWNVLKVKVDDVGRKASYDFEKEQWYIDLKKKIKPHQPIFPPPKPKGK